MRKLTIENTDKVAYAEFKTKEVKKVPVLKPKTQSSSPAVVPAPKKNLFSKIRLWGGQRKEHVVGKGRHIKQQGKQVKKRYSASNKRIASRRSLKFARNNISGAKGQMVGKYGIGAYFRPKMWALSVLKLSLSQPLLIIIFALIAGITLATWLFGWLSLYYGIFFLKCCLATIINLFLTLGNAFWFSIHGIMQLIMAGILEIINAIGYWFTGPIYQALEFIWTAFGVPDPPVFPELGAGTQIPLQPTNGFAYLIPDNVVTAGGTVSFSSFFGFVFVQPGAYPYTGEYIAVYEQNGAELLFPEINTNAISTDSDGDGEPDFWAPIADRPPDDITYAFDKINATTWIEFSFSIADWITNTLIPMVRDNIMGGINDFMGTFTNPKKEGEQSTDASRGVVFVSNWVEITGEQTTGNWLPPWTDTGILKKLRYWAEYESPWEHRRDALTGAYSLKTNPSTDEWDDYVYTWIEAKLSTEQIPDRSYNFPDSWKGSWNFKGDYPSTPSGGWKYEGGPYI